MLDTIVETEEGLGRDGLIFIRNPKETGDYNLPSSFERRDKKYQGEYTEGRALEAFNDWRKWRELILKGKPNADRETRSEMMVGCNSIQEAMDLVRELMGNSQSEERHLIESQAVMFGPLRKTGFNPVTSGFAVTKSLDNRGQTVSYIRYYYIDYDGKDLRKGLHFNVVVQPEVGSKNGPESIKLAFSFPMPVLDSSIQSPAASFLNIALQLEDFLIDEEYLPPNFQLGIAEKLDETKFRMIQAVSYNDALA